ncbi:MAG: bifunctional chorismate mutase/prephenate dehydrogenase [Deltaproteobacteria bacterium]|nr:bifunctional chorismate mutase/prephenate dehydrogenase [Deltaproteobacteria bacterium]
MTEEPTGPNGPGNGAPDRDEALAELRARIDSIDSRLVDLLAERLSVVESVAAVKREHDLPIYHPAREEDLISRRRAQAREARVDPDLVEDVLRRILRQSRATQAAALASRGVKPGAGVLIVGGGGEMGRLLAGWFGSAGYRVRVLERDDWERAGELCRGIELAVLSVPIQVTGEVARSLGPHLPRGCVLADVTSVKSEPVAAMLAAHAGPVLGLHPMFGPGIRGLDRQIVVATPGRNEDACRWVVDQLAAWGAVIVWSSAEEHDRIMAFVQALRHFATFAFGQFLHESRADLRRTLEVSSPIYRLELGMVGRLFAQDPELYADIIFATPERRALLASYVSSVAANAGMLERADREAFVAEFRRIADWFGPFAEQAIRESNYLIEKMTEL